MSDYDEDLTPVLELASSEDLDPLVKYLSRDPLSSMLTDDEEYKEYSPDHTVYVSLIEHVFRCIAGNWFVNIFRGRGPAYHDIVCDIADKFAAEYHDAASAEKIESAIMLRILERAWQLMSKKQQQELCSQLGLKTMPSTPAVFPLALVQVAVTASGLMACKMAVLIANAAARNVLRKGLADAARDDLAKSLNSFAGPVGRVVAELWATDKSSPYRVTVPCVLHIAMLRKKQKTLPYRPAIGLRSLQWLQNRIRTWAHNVFPSKD